MRVSPSLFALCAALAVLLPPLTAQSQEPPTRVIVVSGEGQAVATPDMASLRIGVTTQAETANTALAENTARMTAVMSLLSAQGIAERDLQTSDFSVQPVYDRGTNGARAEIIGYSVRNMVHVRLRDLDAVGSVLDAVVGEGSNTLAGLSFGLADPDAKQKEAEADAVADALERAAGMAAAAGLQLGAVQRIEAGNGGGPRPMMEMAARASDAGAVPVAAGELTFRAQVRVTIALVE